MNAYYEVGSIRIFHGDCRDVVGGLSGVTSVVSDPPYGLGFMGKGWDRGVPGREFWELIGGSCLPGAMLLAFGGTRTYHRLVCAIEDGGFEIRDQIQWLYGSGFPKSCSISKQLDKAAGAERKEIPVGRAVKRMIPGADQNKTGWVKDNGREYQPSESVPATDAAKTWNGYGTALKPAHEPICVAMKPLEGTFAQNAVEHGVGGMNIDGSRVAVDPAVDDPRLGGKGDWSSSKMAKNVYGGYAGERVGSSEKGRWPANVIHDGSDEVLNLFPDDNPSCKSKSLAKPKSKFRPGQGNYQPQGVIYPNDHGSSAARFFYCAKESDREIQPSEDFPLWGEAFEAVRNTHPTVKPIALMEYLVKLVTMPERNLILDPFMGSGSTLIACKRAGIPAIGIELNEGYAEIAAKRLQAE